MHKYEQKSVEEAAAVKMRNERRKGENVGSSEAGKEMCFERKRDREQGYNGC